MLNILVTFNTTTATLKGQKLLFMNGSKLKSSIKQEVISVPYSLSETCYGLGLLIEVEDKEVVTQIFDFFKKEEVDFKRFWKLKNEKYIDITADLKEEGKN